jgi:hypothetical protein
MLAQHFHQVKALEHRLHCGERILQGQASLLQMQEILNGND